MKFKIIMDKILSVLKTHKKKCIAIVVIPLLIYIIKKKITIHHLILFVQKVSTLVSYIPLQNAPIHRKMPEFQHIQLGPISQILTAMDIENIKQKIRNKQATWDQLKHSIFTGVILTLCLYNIQSYYFIVQKKYQEDFKTLNASLQFEQLMFQTRKRFIDEIPFIFQSLKVLLLKEIVQLRITESFFYDDFEKIIDNLVKKVFQSKININTQPKLSKVKSFKAQNRKEMQIAVNMLMTNQEYREEESNSSHLYRFISGTYNLINSLFSINWFPDPLIEVTSERYYITKEFYSFSLKKVSTGDIRWPCEESKYLGELVKEEMQFTIDTLNFNTLLLQNAMFNQKMLLNRIKMYFMKVNKVEMPLSLFLPNLYKIIKEQFLTHDSHIKSKKYYEQEIKKSLFLVKKEEQNASCIEKEQNELQQNNIYSTEVEMLQQIYFRDSLTHLQKQFELICFSERSGVVIKPSVDQKSHPREQSNQMEQLLRMMGDNPKLNSSE